MNLIADTNVWYDIAATRRSPSVLKGNGAKLVATPISFLEIASLIDQHTFAERKAAALAVVNHADSVIEDGETRLALLCGLPHSPPTVDWMQGFIAISQAGSVRELNDGVADFMNRVRRHVDLNLANMWRTYHWTDFERKVIDAIDGYVPGYKNARARKKARYMPKGKRDAFINAMWSSECQETMFTQGVFGRALLVVRQPYRLPTAQELQSAKANFTPYVHAYTEYMIRCATQYTPQPNDLGDSDCFLYMQDQNRFLSSDKRWVSIATDRCPNYYCDPEIIV